MNQKNLVSTPEEPTQLKFITLSAFLEEQWPLAVSSVRTADFSFHVEPPKSIYAFVIFLDN